MELRTGIIASALILPLVAFAGSDDELGYGQVKSTAGPGNYCEIRLPPDFHHVHKWQPGLDYVAVGSPQCLTSDSKKVEVVVRTLYTSDLARRLEPYLQKWLLQKPDYIQVIRKPTVRMPHALRQARAVYTFEQMGLRNWHDKYFSWIVDNGSERYDTYHQIWSPDDDALFKLNLEFAKTVGLDPEAFSKIYLSKKMDEKLTGDWTASAGVGGEEILINGIYMTSLYRLARGDQWLAKDRRTFASLFALIEYLAASEHARMTKAQ